MFISFKILLLIAVWIINSEQLKRFQLDRYTEETVKKHWSEIVQQTAQSEEIIINFSGLTENTLNKFLSLPMQNLKRLSFGGQHVDIRQPSFQNDRHQQFLTHKLLKTIFNSPYFEQLEELNLIGTNIDDNFLTFISKSEGNRNSTLKKLMLGSNQIGRMGFESISNINFGSVTQLDVSGNLLIQPQSVTSIIKMICASGANCKRKLVKLDLSSTNINGADLLRIFEVIDPSALVTLNISNLNLHQKNKYQEGFDLTTYQALSNIQFTNLQQLAMTDLALDQKILSLFQKWKFSSLKALLLHKNFINDDGVKYWITKDNFPRLQSLILALTDIKDKGLKFIMDQKFAISELNIGMTQLTRHGLKQLNNVNTTLLQKLFLKSINVQSSVLKDFFQNNSFQNLKELSLTENKEISNLFQYLPWQKLEKLKTLILTNTYIEESLSNLLNKETALLPSLQYLMLNGTGFSAQSINKIISKISVLFPSLKYANLIPEFASAINFTQLKFSSHPNQVNIELGYASFVTNASKFVLDQIKTLSWIILYSSKSDLTPIIEPISQHYIKLSQEKTDASHLDPKLLASIVEELDSLFSIEHLKKVFINNKLQWDIFEAWIQRGSIRNFQQLSSFYILTPLQSEKLASILTNIRMPMLRNLRIIINVTSQTETFVNLLKPLNTLSQIVDLKIQFYYPSSFSRKKNYNHFLNQLKFGFLMSLDLSMSHLQTQQIGGIIYNHAPTLRFLNVNSNFLEKSFLQLMASYQIVLKSIDISTISFSQSEFGSLGEADLSFIIDFKADKCGLTDRHMLSFVETNRKYRHHLFPKLGLLSLNQNQIREKGVRILFEQSLYNLISIRIKRNYNPHFINIILTYTSKIQELVAVDVQLYALDRNIQPISTRRILIFAIQTYSFSQSDYQILASLNFQRLKESLLMLKSQFLAFYQRQCEDYLDQLQWLASSTRKQLHQFRKVQQLGVYQTTDKSFIPKFIELMLTSKKNWRKIMLERLRLPPDVFLLINPERLQHLQLLYIGQSYIDDEGFSRILQSPLQNLQILRIKDTDITMNSLCLLANRTFPSLEHLDLSGLPLGDEGIHVLSSLNANKLKVLILERCDITSLKKFHLMRFPMVYQLLLSYNYLTASDLIDFLINLDKKTWPSLWMIVANGFSPLIDQMESIQRLAKEKGMSIKLDGQHYQQWVNSANY